MSTSAHDRSPPSPAASSSSESSAPPSTPPLSSSLPMATFMNFTSDDAINGVPSLVGAKRTAKNTRRVNTAERRATHNAVERARRETLNGRFLDLAALLPNLNTIRRPSKSAIVNSSIAHLNASRRHRILAAQTLRMIKDETDALRHEINQWRARAGVQSIDEPSRGDAFSVILSGELEFEQSDLLDGSEEGDEDDGSGYAARPYSAVEPSPEEYAMHQQQRLAQAQMQQQQHHGVYPAEPGYYPAAATHSPVYENPAAGYYEPVVHGHPDLDQQQQQQWAYEKQRRMSLPASYPHQSAQGLVRPGW